MRTTGVKKRPGAAEHAFFSLSSSGTLRFVYVVAHGKQPSGQGARGSNNKFGAHH